MDLMTKNDLHYILIKKRVTANKQELEHLNKIKEFLTLEQVEALNIINTRIERRNKELQKSQIELSKFKNLN